MKENPMYCPLCGAHEFEHGEGTPSTGALVEWAEEIESLSQRIQIFHDLPQWLVRCSECEWLMIVTNLEQRDGLTIVDDPEKLRCGRCHCLTGQIVKF